MAEQARSWYWLADRRVICVGLTNMRLQRASPKLHQVYHVNIAIGLITKEASMCQAIEG